MAHVREEQRLGLVGALGLGALRLGLRQRGLQACGALAHQFLQALPVLLDLFARLHLLVDVGQHAGHVDAAIVAAVGACAQAEPAVLTRFAAHAQGAGHALQPLDRRIGLRAVDRRVVLVHQFEQRAAPRRQLARRIAEQLDQPVGQEHRVLVGHALADF